MSLSRRRSCVNCSKSKRRCDLGTPACNRCRARRVTCSYPPLPTSGGSNEPTGEVGTAQTSFNCPNQRSGTESRLQLGQVDTSGVLDECLGVDSIADRVYSFQPLNPFSPNITGDAVKEVDLPFYLDPLFSMSPIPDSTQIKWPLEPIPDTVPNSLVPPQQAAASTSIFIPRTEYAVRLLNKQVPALVKEGQNIFIHHTQISTSALLQEALAASSLHVSQNSKNEALVRGEVSRKVSELVHHIRTAGMSTDFDLLPCVQALNVYQCIRLFSSNNIVQQGQAERDIHLALALTSRLRDQLQPLDITAGWPVWIRQETTRRAILFSELVDGCYTFLKTGRDDSEPRIAPLSFYAQTALWEARSSVEWRTTCARLPSLQVTVNSIGSDLASCGPHDLDDLGIIIKALTFGLERLEEWTNGDVDVLKRMGLRPE